mmetsp:Transcript_25795/g.56904  ORF Transcript_25795/g.56904 Transcript_25795/m.56904 type:complete len:291 (+) Transcript_25795:3-875(+)
MIASRRLFRHCEKNETNSALECLDGDPPADPNYVPDARVKVVGLTPLHYACCHINPVLVAALLEARSDLRSVDTSGFTPLHSLCSSWATTTGQHQAGHRYSGPPEVLQQAAKECAESLVSAGGDPSAVDQFSGTPFHWLATARLEGEQATVAIAGILLQADAAVAALGLQDAEGKIPEELARDNRLKALESLFQDAVKVPVKVVAKPQERRRRRWEQSTWTPRGPWKPVGESPIAPTPTTPRLDTQKVLQGKHDLRSPRQQVKLCYERTEATPPGKSPRSRNPQRRPGTR